MKLRIFYAIFVCALSFLKEGFAAQDASALIDELKRHVFLSIERAQAGQSKLPSAALTVEGASSSRVRHLLNNLCARPGTRYLEIGCYKGSTCVGALYGNDANVEDAIAIDMWAEQPYGIKEAFLKNVGSFLPTAHLRVYQVDCFKIDLPSTFPRPINLYFYDGDHSFEAQKAAFTVFDPILDDIFIAVVDDWNWSRVQQGTYAAFKELGYELLLEIPLFTPGNCSVDSWWNGLFIGIIKKTSGPH